MAVLIETIIYMLLKLVSWRTIERSASQLQSLEILYVAIVSFIAVCMPMQNIALKSLVDVV